MAAVEAQANIRLVPEPTSLDHLVPGRWVIRTIQGFTKEPVRLVATNPQAGAFSLPNKTFTYTAQGPVTIDGEEVDQGDAILFAGQADKTQNLLYTCTQKGTVGTDSTVLTLREDADEDYQTGITVVVTDGSNHAGTTFRLTTQGTIIIGTTALDWEPYTPPKTTSLFPDEFTAADGTSTPTGGMEWEIEHNLNNVNVLVQLYNRDSNAQVIADVVTTDPNTVTIGFAEEPPATAGYRVVVIG